ncbi:MAG: A/G-specific adenine glycosylase [Lachnospiraceae bacterium]|nr:A/G-specific adenine glycosylase [Lachnospiraceae bacterium]
MDEIVKSLLRWYQSHKRELPWRRDRNPYHIWVSEIMLQQTRVEAVKDYYQRFLEALPDIFALAAVEDDVLMKLWQGLGYYNRARNLKKSAVLLVEQYGGEFPESFTRIQKLPGIGIYTAGAIASIAFGERVPAVDGNVYRIYTRLFEDGDDISKGAVQKRIREKIAEMVPEENPGDFNQALMDLGANVCLPNGEPLCADCPLEGFCLAKKNETMMQYPYKSPGKKRRIEEKTVFILEYHGKYCLQKRPETGLLAGLWEFPVQEGNLTVQEVLGKLEEWGEMAEELELLGKAKHIFSHIEWRMIGYLVRLKAITPEIRESFILASKEELREKYSIPSAYVAYLRQLL